MLQYLLLCILGSFSSMSLRPALDLLGLLPLALRLLLAALPGVRLGPSAVRRLGLLQLLVQAHLLRGLLERGDPDVLLFRLLEPLQTRGPPALRSPDVLEQALLHPQLMQFLCVQHARPVLDGLAKRRNDGGHDVADGRARAVAGGDADHVALDERVVGVRDGVVLVRGEVLAEQLVPLLAGDAHLDCTGHVAGGHDDADFLRGHVLLHQGRDGRGFGRCFGCHGGVLVN